MEAARIPWRTLGELFVQRGLISNDQLEDALAEQATSDRRLGEILVEGGLVSAQDLRQALMEQLGVEISDEGFGSSLWAEIKRRHEDARGEEDGAEDDEEPLPPAAHEELEPRPEPPALVALPPLQPEELQPEPEVEPLPEAEPLPEPQLEPIPIEPVLETDHVPATEIAALRAELDEARAEADRLREMLADSMTALSALIAESGPAPDEPAPDGDAWHDS